MANWTPTGLVGQMFKIVSSHVPPPAGMLPPVLWGVDATVRERFSEGISKLETKARMISLAYPFSPAEVVEYFRNYFGPAQKAFAALDESGQVAFRRDLEQLWTENNLATDGTTRIEAEYLEVIAVRS
jgi:hypothetical protein